MRRKKILRSLGILLFGLLAACGTGPAKGVDGDAATKIVATFMAQITQTAAASALTAVAPVETLTGESPEATETPFAAPAPDAGTQLLGRFRTVTVIKGNLFVRDGTGLPVQITKSGTDHDPVISSDGQKIAFYRGAKSDKIFIVNADGSQENELVNAKLLPDLINGRIANLTFRPGMYDLFFSSHFCRELICGSDILFVNTESKITKLVDVSVPTINTALNFALSPDGKYMSVIAPQQIDLYDLTDSKQVLHNIFSSSLEKNIFQFQYWLPDSSGLIALGEMQDDYAIWRYSLKENHAEQLQLVPSKIQTSGEKMRCAFSISPDRNWIFYHKNEKEYGLVSLKDAQIKSYVRDPGCAVNGAQWSPDSRHFASQTAIGAVDGTSLISIDGHFIAWLDATHYLFSKGTSILDLQTYVAEVGNQAAVVQTNFIWSPVFAVMEPRP